ncbi:BBE domain-containing protein [Streptomyces sp. LARHCF249]
MRRFAAALEPHSLAGGYVNFMDHDARGQARVRVNYRQNHDRLAAVERRYGPDNLFRLNHDVLPGPAPAPTGSWAVPVPEGAGG